MISNQSLLQAIQGFIFFCILFTSGLSMAKETQYPTLELKPQLEAALKNKGVDYQPRTEHLLANGQPEYVNRLILEDSPYLLQHAHNPVQWYAWGDEAFALAKRENKPIFLSIGYSTCFWCHVMERESFENKEIATFLNTHFINIKVDRERRPDVDEVYMMAVTLITGSGGWPMSSFLTPEGKTFIGGTYFPPENFKDLIGKINELWLQQPQILKQQAQQVALEVEKQFSSQQQAKKIDSKLLTQNVEEILSRYDPINSGFGLKPKFPLETWLMYLLESHLRSGNVAALEAVEKSLQAMAQGGIYDQIGGGFHRYSTDEKWLIPHFEKMLYNQAQLSRVYLLAYQITGKKLYAQIATETLEYVLDTLTDENGGFYSATDADSKEGEGSYFLWTVAEIKQALSPELANLAIDFYGITAQGNFEGKNILHLKKSLVEYAKQQNLDLSKLEDNIQQIKTKLKLVRQQRVSPFKDNKLLTAWNGMMIQSFTLASETLNNVKYLNTAKKAAKLIWSHQDLKTKQLWRVHLQGRSSITANQEDYAYYAESLLQLYDVTGDEKWLERARQITDTMLSLFWDVKQGGFFMNTSAKNTTLMVRPKITKDNETAAANAVAMRVLSRLSKRVNNPEYEAKANQLLAAFSGQVFKSPLSHNYLLLAAADFLYSEQGAVQYAAKGAVSVKGRSILKQQQFEVEFEINIKPHWHINAHQPLQKYLIPTSVSLAENGAGWQLGSVNYPKPIEKKLNFQRQTLALYEGKIKLQVPLNKIKQGANLIPLEIKLQACDDKICLPPETLLFQIPVK